MTRKSFKVPLYGQRVTVIVSEDPPNVAAQRHRLPVPFERHHARLRVAACTWSLPNGNIAVCLRPRADINTLSHEAFHIALFTAERVGLPELISPYGEIDFGDVHEALAYIVGSVTESLWKITRVKG